MAILKKIRAATLVETMVASVIIVLVFLIASLSLNNVFMGAVQGNDASLQNRVKELTYLAKNKKIAIPFYEDTNQWDIAIEKQNRSVLLTVLNKQTAKEKQLKIIDEAH